jgi:rfaE bifunctional protein nucleotidyltransferase chain/domain
VSSWEEKIRDLDELVELVAKRREQGETIVHCHGVFDLIHPGHIRVLEAAAQRGDCLVVTVVADRFVDLGPHRPVFNQRLRAETLAALQRVDYVALNETDSAADAIRRLRPDVYVQGGASAACDDHAVERLRREREAVLEVGGRLQPAEESAFSSTHLLNRHFDVLHPEANEYLQELARSWSADDVVAAVRALREVRVLVVGDTILDEYHFCRAYGKASKSSAISAKFLAAERYAGGALAVANHVAGFCDQVHLITCLGEQDPHLEFVQSHLKPNVSRQFFFRSDAPTTVKRRFVEDFLMTKFFEVSFFDDSPLPAPVEAEAKAHLARVAPGYDLVLVADFGHGLMTPGLVDAVCEVPGLLAINTQLNSINAGYNVVTRYPRADYACIDEQETRLAARDRFGPLAGLVRGLADQLGCRVMTTTRGRHGSLVFERGRGLFEAPVLSRDVVDTIGAGDALLAVTAPCVAKGYPAELIGLVGNAVGALAVRVVGNKESVEPRSLIPFLRSLLRR